jgi:hypothetical protein
MIWENSYGHRMPKGVIANVPVRPTWAKSNVRVTSALLLKTDSVNFAATPALATMR